MAAACALKGMAARATSQGTPPPHAAAENMLLSTHGIMKLCDFGFARQMGGEGARYSDYVATRWYRAPELLLGEGQYDASVDIWAIGALGCRGGGAGSHPGTHALAPCTCTTAGTPCCRCTVCS